jgi:hypothetical protein
MENNQNDFGILVSQAMLRELANTLGRKLALAYAANVNGITQEPVGNDLQLRLHVDGPYRDITMRFAEPIPVYAGFDDVEDHEL